MERFTKQNEKNCMLIIDDDIINREILKNMFAGLFMFREAENGLEGLHIIEQHCDCLGAILLDVNMPVMDGMQLLNILHERNILGRVPVFLITSNEELEISRVAYEMGVMGVINKPVVPFIAVRRVQLVVELFRARDALNDKVRRQERTLQENVQTIDTLHRNTIEAMASAIEFRDVESGAHTNRIYAITKLLLSETDMGTGITDEEIENIAVGSIMHDVGKIAISDLILNKPGKLTREEFEIMKGHTVKGDALMEQLIKMQPHASYYYAKDIARHHHERWDGKGYPDGLKGDEITVWSQVVSIADVYDALVSPRVYKRAYAPETAVEMIIGGQCGAFNPKLLHCFLQVEPQIRALYADSREDTQAQVLESNEMSDYLLLTSAIQEAYDLILCINVTANSYFIFNSDRYLTNCPKQEGVLDALVAGTATSIPEPYRQRFLDTVSRQALLEAHREGKKTLTLQYRQYTDGGELVDGEMTVLFVEDPRTGDLRDITLVRYLNKD